MKLKDEEKEQRIKEVTLEIVSEVGIAGVKMAAVAKKAGLSPSSLYVYYKSKEELLKAIFRDTIALMLKSDLGISIQDTPYKAQIELLYRKILGFKKNHEKENYFLKQFSKSPFYDTSIQNEMKDLGAGYVQVIAYGREQMILKDDIDIHLLMALIDGMTEKLVEYNAKGKLLLTEEIINQAFRVVWDGMKQ